MLDRRADDRTVGRRLKAIALLLSHAFEGIEPTDQRLQLAQLPRQRCPRGRLVGATELGDEPRVGRIGFGARQATPGLKASIAAGLTMLTRYPASCRVSATAVPYVPVASRPRARGLRGHGAPPTRAAPRGRPRYWRHFWIAICHRGAAGPRPWFVWTIIPRKNMAVLRFTRRRMVISLVHPGSSPTAGGLSRPSDLSDAIQRTPGASRRQARSFERTTSSHRCPIPSVPGIEEGMEMWKSHRTRFPHSHTRYRLIVENIQERRVRRDYIWDLLARRSPR